MPGLMLDTSCMVALVCSWHERHLQVATEFESRLAKGERLLVPGPALVETYAVLTRLPPPHRLSPRDSLALLEANFMTEATIVALEGDSYVALLRRAAAQGTAGGRIYDAVIADCGVAASAETILTLNGRHFMTGSHLGPKIVIPGFNTG